MGQQDDYRNLGPQEKWRKEEREREREREENRFKLVRIDNKE
jgi:hypothetical protein